VFWRWIRILPAGRHVDSLNPEFISFEVGKFVIDRSTRTFRAGTAFLRTFGRLARQYVEAGGVEPPSEKRYGPKPTCLSHSIWFAGCAWNAQDAQPTSPMNLGGKPRTEVIRPAYCVTPLTEPAGEARGNGLR
jgi:hypothetical protein